MKTQANRFWNFFLIFPLLLIGIGALPSAGYGADDITIGYIMPLTGPESPTGDISLKGAQFAVSKVNAAGGIKSLGGKKLKLLLGDSEGKPEVGVSQTERLAGGGVVGFQGTYQSGVAYPATAMAERMKTPFLVSMAYADPITQRGLKYTFRSCTRAGLLAVDMIDFAKDMYKAFNAPLNTAVVIYDDSLYGKSLWESSEPIFKKTGIKVLDTIYYPVGATDLTAEVVRAKKTNADAFFIHAYASDGILFVKTFRELGFNPKAIICPGAGPKVASYINSLGRLSENIYVLNDTNWDVSERAKKLGKEYKDLYKIDFTGLSMYEYLGIMIWKEVLEKAASLNKEKIRETFANIEITNPEIIELLPYDKVKFGPDGQSMYVRNTMAMVKDGVLRTVWPKKSASLEWVFPAPTWEEKMKGK
jgi:branched-chain amino acid transport system substrate-binding protein